MLQGKQKEARVVQIQNQIYQLKSFLQDNSNVLAQIFGSDSPQKDIIVNWARLLEELHDLGEYKEDIGTISSTIKAELTKMGFPKSTHWVHEVLPFKYKQDKYNPYREDEEGVVEPHLDSSLQNYEIENSEYLKLIDDTIIFFKEIVKPKLKSAHFCSLLDQEDLQEFYLVHRNVISHMGINIFNDKRKDLEQTECLLVNAVLHVSATHAGEQYMSQVKSLYGMTGKQVRKILTGHARGLHPLYDPKNREEAMKVGFYGMRCGQCSSWRVDLVNAECFCYSCRSTFDPVTEVIKGLE